MTEPSSRMEFCGLSTEQAEEGDGEGRGPRGPLSQGQQACFCPGVLCTRMHIYVCEGVCRYS